MFLMHSIYQNVCHVENNVAFGNAAIYCKHLLLNNLYEVIIKSI